MRHRFLLQSIFSFFLLTFLCEKSFAQQSLFNAFSGERTSASKHFYQAQANVVQRDRSVLNNTYDYGVSDHIEVGINWFDIPISSMRGDENDQELLLNAQYFQEVTSYLQLSGGGQSGVVRKHKKGGRYAQLLFLNSRWQEPHFKSALVVGIIYSNSHFLDTQDVIVQLGVDIPLFHDKLHFIADYLSGKSENSVGVIGGSISMTSDWTLSLGYQYPAAHSENNHGVVAELTFVQP